MTQQMTLEEMTTAGAHQHGHFRLSSGLHSGSSSGVGASRATMPFRKPAASKATCQSSIPCLR